MKHQFEYPIGTVLAGFTFGGVFGGLIVFIVEVIEKMMDLNLHIWMNDLGSILLASVGYAILGIIFGFIPAFLTGIYCSLRKIVIKNWKSYLHLYLVGTLCSAIYFATWVNFSDYTLEYIFELWAMGSIGGISAMICGKLFLPKLQDLSIQFYQNSSLGDKI